MLTPGETEALGRRLEDQIVAVARGMMAGETDLIEGVRRIDELATGLGRDLEEPFLTFKSVASQADAFPDSRIRHLYEPAALARIDEDRREFLELFRDRIHESCVAIIDLLEVRPDL